MYPPLKKDRIRHFRDQFHQDSIDLSGVMKDRGKEREDEFRLRPTNELLRKAFWQTRVLQLDTQAKSLGVDQATSYVK